MVCLLPQGKKLPANISEDAEEGEVSDEDSADEIDDDCKLLNGDVSGAVGRGLLLGRGHCSPEEQVHRCAVGERDIRQVPRVVCKASRLLGTCSAWGQWGPLPAPPHRTQTLSSQLVACHFSIAAARLAWG